MACSKAYMFAALAAGVALLLTATTPALAQPARPAASSACGSSCMTISSAEDNTGWAMEVAGSTAVGTNVYMVGAGNNENEDFVLLNEGTVKEFYEDGIFNSVVGTTWPNDEVYEYLYAPGGVESDLCLGETSLGAALSLQYCGVSAVTCWIPLTNDKIDGAEPLVTAIDNVANTPYVMDAPGVYSEFNTEELSLYQGTFSPYQMMFYQNGVL
jgi:hypothetical protein